VTAIRDAHCHFFSEGFFRALGREAGVAGDAALELPDRLGWDQPGDARQLADRWVAELDRAGVAEALLIASAPGDEASVIDAVERAGTRIAGAFMVNPAAPDAASRVDQAFAAGLRTACLFPAMHGVAVDDPRALAVFGAAAGQRRAVFVHCGVLSIGARKRLGLPSRFDLRLGDPLAVAAVAVRYPDVPVVIPHFGAGFFREALMAVQAAPNVYLDTSSSNRWTALHPGLTLRDVFARALDVAGPTRLLFGTDSSFFPRGWQRAVYDEQRAIVVDLGVDSAGQAAIFGGNFSRVFRGA
jgi:predicted TIM-barrel fold metal-dependent hydrolase